MSASEGVFAGGQWVAGPEGWVYVMPDEAIAVGTPGVPTAPVPLPFAKRPWYRVPGWLLGQALLFVVGAVYLVTVRPLGWVGKRLWHYRLVRLVAKPFVFVALLAWKLKALAVVLFKLKGVATLTTLVVSLAAYSWFWSWPFALGLVALLFVHECGHWLVLRQQGIKTHPILFIPFLGAVIGFKEMPKDAFKEAQMALGGPLVGSAGALALWAAADAFHSPILRGLAYTGFLLNLFNLIPLVPFDGGRVAAAIHWALWPLGLVGFVALAVWWQAWSMLAMLALVLPVLASRWGQRKDPVYYALGLGRRVGVGVAYVGLALALAVGMRATYQHKPSASAASFHLPSLAYMITPACYTWWSPSAQRYVAGPTVPKGAQAPEDVVSTIKHGHFVVYALGHGREWTVNWRPCGSETLSKS